MYELMLLMLFILSNFLILKNKKYVIVPSTLGLFLIFYKKTYRVVLNVQNISKFLIWGLVIGHLSFFISVFLTSLKLERLSKILKDTKRIAIFYFEKKFILIKYLLISSYEELLWRATIQEILGNSYLSVVLTSLLFTLVHIKGNEIYLLELFDMFLFSVILGVIFLKYQNIYPLIVIHTMRNVNIFYLEAKNDKNQKPNQNI